MEKSEIEYLISDIIMKTEEITILQWEINNCVSDKMIKVAKEALQLLYVNRDLVKEELMDLGE
jgi:hypothetical protein